MDTRFYDSRSHQMQFEVQLDKFSCGAVAVINAIRYDACIYECNLDFLNSDGDFKTRLLKALNTRLLHDDGFTGTKPNMMTKLLGNLWQVDHRFGSKDCNEILSRIEINEKYESIYYE